MIEWHNPSERLPADRQECLLMPMDHGGLTTVGVYGPIAWEAQYGQWVDLWRNPEAGEIITPSVVGLWTDWEAIKPEGPGASAAPSGAGEGANPSRSPTI